MRKKKVLLILQGIKLGLDTIEIIKIDFRQKRIEILSAKIQKEINKIQDRKGIFKTLKKNVNKIYFENYSKK